MTLPETSVHQNGRTEPEKTPLFAADGVTVRFGGLTALDGVSVDVRSHEVHGVIGPNGAGKTTLFNVCCGFVRPDQGTLSWRGTRLPDLRPHRLTRLGIARTLQGLGLFRGLTVAENVLVGADRFRRSGFVSALLALPRAARDERALAERAERAMAEVGVLEHAHASPASLPYPVRKRVALARALAAEPELLLLDEPAAGLGHDDMEELAGTVRRLAERMAVVLVDHHMDLVMSVCDRLTVLDFGRVIAAGEPERVRDDPAVVDAYLGEEADR
ncbi:ABC transporter ATP-binding protein [Saccharomonospora saliphila]|uniref:ABC transporter ATP-binding protein n=1 Tax=Saccharomonospora saliphila TaxID=369829 RepID=UPI0003649F5B|nr:ATP-binding cassette domain-containing protein [Saccharomonospora saliphila]